MGTGAGAGAGAEERGGWAWLGGHETATRAQTNIPNVYVHNSRRKGGVGGGRGLFG